MVSGQLDCTASKKQGIYTCLDSSTEFFLLSILASTVHVQSRWVDDQNCQVCHKHVLTWVLFFLGRFFTSRYCTYNRVQAIERNLSSASHDVAHAYVHNIPAVCPLARSTEEGDIKSCIDSKLSEEIQLKSTRTR